MIKEIEITYDVKKLTPVELLSISTEVLVQDGEDRIVLTLTDWGKILGHIAATNN